MSTNYQKLNAENAFIWRIVHRDNVPWILDNGLHCGNSSTQSPDWVHIGNADIIDKRNHRIVPLPPGGNLNDYVPFYFTPFSPMMYNIYTGRGGVKQRINDEIIILVSSLHKAHQFGHDYLFTDSHAYPVMANYYNDLQDLDEIDWSLLRARNFKRNPDDPRQIDRYQAEALVHQHLPIDALIGMICYTKNNKAAIESEVVKRSLSIDVHNLPNWYF